MIWQVICMKIFETFETIIKYVSGMCLAVMVILVVINTILRYSISSSIVQTEELCRYLFLWSTYLAVITVYRKRQHIKVTILTDYLSQQANKILAVAVEIMSIVVLGILAYGSYLYFEESTMIGQVTYIPYKAMIAPVMIAGICCIFLSVQHLYNMFKS